MPINTVGVFGIPAGVSVTFSNNNGKAHKGGTCFGDSGGPTFESGSSKRGDQSFGSSYSAGTEGGYRIDKAADLGFIESFLGD